MQTTRDIPTNRINACAVAFHSRDQTTTQVYVYGGSTSVGVGDYFDDVYILTIPSFTWVRAPISSRDGSKEEARYGMVCISASPRTMMAVGGAPLGVSTAQVPTDAWDASCNTSIVPIPPIRVLDVSNLTWLPRYEYNPDSQYDVPKSAYKVTGWG